MKRLLSLLLALLMILPIPLSAQAAKASKTPSVDSVTSATGNDDDVDDDYGDILYVVGSTDAETYRSAVDAYEDGYYSTAKKLFNIVDPYKDSSKYLRLIRIRNAGGNIGVGSAVYEKSLGLTKSEKKDIDEAAEDFDFADTSEVLLCNSDVACYYLVGKWNGGSKCYIHFKMNKAGGTYNIGSKLSTNYKSTFSIDDGELRVDVIDTDKLTLQLKLISPNKMEVYTYEKGGKTYTLKRK